MRESKPVILSILPRPGDELLAAPLLLSALSRDDFYVCSLALYRGEGYKRSFSRIGKMGFALVEPTDPAQVFPEADDQAIEGILLQAFETLQPTVVLSPSPWMGLPGYWETGKAAGSAVSRYAVATGSAPVWWMWGSPFLANLAYFSIPSARLAEIMPYPEFSDALGFSAYLAKSYLGFNSDENASDLLLEAQMGDDMVFRLGPRRIADPSALLPFPAPDAPELGDIAPSAMGL